MATNDNGPRPKLPRAPRKTNDEENERKKRPDEEKMMTEQGGIKSSWGASWLCRPVGNESRVSHPLAPNGCNATRTLRRSDEVYLIDKSRQILLC